MKTTTHRPSIRSRARRILASAMRPAALALLATQAHAGNTWDGGGGDDNWGTGANWSPDGSPAPGSGNDLFFAGSTRLTPFNNYTAFDNWRNITFNSGASSFNITGNAIDLFGKIENLSANTQTFGLGSIALNSGTANEFNPVNGNLTITSANIFTNGNELKVFGNNGFTLNFAAGTNIQQGGALAINQNSTVIFNSAHSYTGDTLVNAGKLQFNTGGTATSTTIRLGATSGAADAEMDLIAATGGQSLANTIVARAGTSGTRTLDSQNTSGTNTLSGVIALDAPLTLKQSTGGTLNLSGSFMDVKQQVFTVNTSGTVNISKSLDSSFGAGGSLVKQGSGTLILSDTLNNYTGTNNATLNANGTRIAGGTLGIHGDASLGLAPAGAYNNIQFTASGTLQDTANNISLHANRSVSVASGATATLDSNGNTFTINGVVNGAGGNLATTGGGTVKLMGNNTFTGTTDVGAGTLEAGAAGALGATSGITVNTGGTLLLSGSGNRINNSAAMDLDGGTFHTGGLSETLGTLSLSENSVIDFGAGASVLHFADSSGATWALGKTLQIWNWSGNPSVGGGTDQLFFGVNNTGLTVLQLTAITFYSDGGITAIPGSAGFVPFAASAGEVAPVPEPSGVLIGLAMFGLAGWRERRKSDARRRQERLAFAS